MNWYFDASVLIAAAVATHQHNGPALARMEELAASRHQGFFSAHGLTEVYSVLTRAPFRPPFYPGEVLQIVEDQIIPLLKLVSLDSKEYVRTVRYAAAQGMVGGQIHDAIHLQCAMKADCDRIYTFNVAHFRKLSQPEFVNRVTAP